MSREEHHRMGTADFVAGGEVQRDTQARPADQGPRPDVGMREPDRMQQPGQTQPPGHVQQPGGPMQQPMQAQRMERPAQMPAGGAQAAEPLAALFPPQVAADFRQRWDAVQIGFVDNPQEAVRQADELVAEVMKSLAQSFSAQRARLESGAAGGQAQDQTEHLRMALRAYRSFFQRLLSL